VFVAVAPSELVSFAALFIFIFSIWCFTVYTYT